MGKGLLAVPPVQGWVLDPANQDITNHLVSVARAGTQGGTREAG